MDAVGVANWQAKSQSLADNNQDNHGISSQKFHLLREFLMLGYRVFLSGPCGGTLVASWGALTHSSLPDVDIVTLQNPFDFLKRDSDIEGLSDGYDAHTAYGAARAALRRAHLPAHVTPGYVDGIDDPGMGWARYAQTIRIFVLNSGLFYIQPSERTISLMNRINDYLKVVKAWDQTVRSRPRSSASPPSLTSSLPGVQRDDLVPLSRGLAQLPGLGAFCSPSPRCGSDE